MPLARHARRPFAWPPVRMLVSSSLIADSSTEEITRMRTTSSPSRGVLLRFVAMDTGSARMLVAVDGVRAESAGRSRRRSPQTTSSTRCCPWTTPTRCSPSRKIHKSQTRLSWCSPRTAWCRIRRRWPRTAWRWTRRSRMRASRRSCWSSRRTPWRWCRIPCRRGRLYAVVVVSFMMIAKHGTVHTRGSIHAAPTRWQKCARNQRNRISERARQPASKTNENERNLDSNPARAITSRLHASGCPAKTNAHARPCKNMMINKINLGNQYSNRRPRASGPASVTNQAVFVLCSGCTRHHI